MRQEILTFYYSQELENSIFGFITFDTMKKRQYTKEQILAIPGMIAIKDVGCFHGTPSSKRQEKIEKSTKVLEDIKDFAASPANYICYCRSNEESYPVVILSLYQSVSAKYDRRLVSYALKLCEIYLREHKEDIYVRIAYCNLLIDSGEYQRLQEEANIGKEQARQENSLHFYRIFDNLLERNKLFMMAKSDQLDLESLNASVLTLDRLATFYFSLRRYKDAITCYQKIMVSRPLAISRLNVLSMCYENLHDYQNAIATLDRMLERKDCNESQRKRALGRKQKCKCYLEAYENREKLDENQAYAWKDYFNFGEGHFHAGRIDKALDYYEKVFALNKNFGPLWFRITACYEKQERYDEALQLLEEASKQPCMKNYQDKIDFKRSVYRKYALAQKGEEASIKPIAMDNCQYYCLLAEFYAKYGYFAWAIYYANEALNFYTQMNCEEKVSYLKSLLSRYHVEALEEVGKISFEAYFDTGDEKILWKILYPYTKTPSLHQMALHQLSEECRKRNVTCQPLALLV